MDEQIEENKENEWEVLEIDQNKEKENHSKTPDKWRENQANRVESPRHDNWAYLVVKS